MEALLEHTRTRRGGRSAPSVELTEEQRESFTRLTRSGKTSQRCALRTQIVLLAAEGKPNIEIAETLGIQPETAGFWRKRFKEHGEKGLQDAPRSGRPPKFSAEQKAAVIQKAIETPRENDVPITHWSKSELARLAQEAGIVESIGTTTVWSWLNEADLKPHLCRTWLRSTDPDFEARMRDVVSLYMRALELTKAGSVVFSIDEKTSMQALERKHPDLQMRPGSPQRREHEYIRHGTLCLTAAFNVGTGEVVGRLTENRPAPVFASFVRQLCESVPNAPEIHLVCDQLNTHWHLDVCQVVAEICGLEFDPKALKTGAQRRSFLRRADKRIVFHFTPKHASWLNQIEIWFSTLQRKVIKRGSFVSKDDLAEKVRAFINYHNAALARPYRWTYTGLPCRK